MMTPSPVLKRGRTVWDQTAMPQAEFKERVRLVQKAMADSGLDLLLVYSDMNDYGNACWLSGYLPKMGWFIVVVPQQGEPILVPNHALREIPFSKTITWMEDIRPAEGPPGLAGQIKAIIAEKLPGGGKVGLAGLREQAPIGIWRAVTDQLGNCGVTAATDLIAGFRQVKSPREIQAMKRSADVVAAVVAELDAGSLAGKREYEVAAQMNYRARWLGAEDVRILLAGADQRPPLFHPPTGDLLSAGKGLHCYLAVAKDRYWSDTALYTPVGESPSPAEKLNSRVEKQLAELNQWLRPGVGMEALVKKLPGDRESGAINRYGWGSGIGLGIEERPFVRPEETAALAAGMTLSLNLLQRHEATVYFRKVNLLITAQGCQPLTGC